jgi:hypothetical protein
VVRVPRQLSRVIVLTLVSSMLVALAGIAGTCGLDIGAESQEETALSMLGEILRGCAGRSGGFLRDAKRRIDAQEDAPALARRLKQPARA